MNSSHKHHLKLVLEAAMDKAIDESAQGVNDINENEGVERVLNHLVKELHDENQGQSICPSSRRHRAKLFNSLGGP